MAKSRPMDFQQMSPSEKILHVQDLWDQITANPDEIEPSEAQRQELDRRLAAHEEAPDEASPWERARGRIRSTR